MLIYWDRYRHFTRGPAPDDQICFGVRKLTAALERAGIRTAVRRRDEFIGDESVRALVITYAGFRTATAMTPEAYKIRRGGEVIYLDAADRTGAMYGLLSLAETIRHDGYDAIADTDAAPFHGRRGIKFNWPFEPYGLGDPFEKNRETVLDTEFWRAYIDFLAENRYNLLSLWSMNPFEMMFRVGKYPDTTPYDDVELERFRRVFDFIFTHAKNRGIATYIMTWNVRVTPAIARGLGLPEQLADEPENRFRQRLRQYEPLIRDYFREAVKTLVMTYPSLTGLGASNSEELVGPPEETEEFITDTYLAAVKEMNIPLPFIHRTNCSNGAVAQKMFLDKYPGKDKLISWKYSNAHMYSHPEPRFEELWGAWENMDVRETKVIYTVRNDDFQTFRGGDAEFIAEYIRRMKKPYVAGFYWGADGYVWADDFQHVGHRHKSWKYDFERHWLQFAMLGRLGYDPETDSALWVKLCAERYGGAAAGPMVRGLAAGTRALCAVTRLHWVDYDFQWNPESLLSTFGFHTIRTFLETPAMPGIGTLSVRETARAICDGTAPGGEDVRDILEILRGCAVDAVSAARDILAALEPEYRGGELECAMDDIRAWEKLIRYYTFKIEAAMLLAVYEINGDKTLKDRAVGLLESAVPAWRELGEIWASHYMPYMMGRVNQIFGYTYYIDEVERDVEIAAHWPTIAERSGEAADAFKADHWNMDR